MTEEQFKKAHDLLSDMEAIHKHINPLMGLSNKLKVSTQDRYSLAIVDTNRLQDNDERILILQPAFLSRPIDKFLENYLSVASARLTIAKDEFERL